uniref:Uncharacterized protein n=1 Tax=Rhizophagus irregularis (strain DAOM 181602 / DAOM 197198 / MUCL 43194) TaxID=747089 RepID=U9TM62_RHIID
MGKLADVVGEHRKNLATLKKCDSEEIKKEKIITVIFMTRAIDPELTYSEPPLETIMSNN